MNAEQLIESYVSDVVGRLPRRQRADVAAELGALLREELAGRAADHRREPDEADAMALLTGFGRPAEVAARYRPTLTIIDPADSRAFLNASVIGVALIWTAGLVQAFQPIPASISDGLRALQTFWFTVGIPALTWPGFLVVWFGLAAWARRRRPNTTVWKPRPAERDTVNRFGAASALVFFVAGTAVLVNPAGALNLIAGGRLGDAGRAALAYDSDFLRLRGPIVLAVLVAQLVLLAVTMLRGRWEPGTRRAHLVLDVLTAAVLAWVLVDGRAFSQKAADQTFKTAIAVVVLMVVVDLVLKARRRSRRLAAAATPRIS